MDTQPTKKDYILPVSILVAAVLVAGAVIYSVTAKAPTGGAPATGGEPNTADISKVGPRDVVLGDVKAPVTVVEYGDYQCPFCVKFFNEVEPSLIKDYVATGKVKVIFRSFQFLGAESTAAGEAAECAKDQGKFWAYHDAIYNTELRDGKENNGNLTRDLFMKLATDLKMDTNAFGQCVDNKTYADQVQKDTAAASAVGVNSTPTSFVNGQKVAGAVPYSQFKAIIDAALQGK